MVIEGGGQIAQQSTQLLSESFEVKLPDKAADSKSVSTFQQAFSSNQFKLNPNLSVYGNSLNIVTTQQVDFSQLSSNVLSELRKVKGNMMEHLDKLVNDPIEPGDTVGLLHKQMTGEILSLELETTSKLLGKMSENLNTLLRQ